MTPQTPPTDRPLTAGDVRYVEGHLDMTHAPSLGAFIGKSLASHVSGNRMPAMSGDNRERIPAHIRDRFDRDCEDTAKYILDRLSRPATSAASEGEDKANHDCLAKRRPGEPMFILLGRDPDAHTIVQLWADRRLAAGGDPDHCRMGYDTAERMATYAKDPANKPASAPDAVDYPALASPPVSERERELEAKVAELEAERKILKAYWPREYVLDRGAEWVRLLRETEGYLQSCRGKCGSDISGREHAIKALKEARSLLTAKPADGGLREALERIADEAPYRSGYCQSDVAYAPTLTAEEMQAVARAALAAGESA